MFYKNIYAICTCSDTLVLLFADCFLLLPLCLLVPLLHNNFLSGHIFLDLSFDGYIGRRKNGETLSAARSLPAYSHGRVLIA